MVETELRDTWQSFGLIRVRLVHEMIGYIKGLGVKLGSRGLFVIKFKKAGAWFVFWKLFGLF